MGPDKEKGGPENPPLRDDHPGVQRGFYRARRVQHKGCWTRCVGVTRHRTFTAVGSNGYIRNHVGNGTS